MFEQLVKRSDWVWTYKMGRFAQERRAFLDKLHEDGHALRKLHDINIFLLAVAERINVRKLKEVTEEQVIRAAKQWVAKRSAPDSMTSTRENAVKRFVYVAKLWLRFLGKWHAPIRNVQFRRELDSFLEELREKRGYTDDTVTARESALNLFFEWLGTQDVALKEVSPQLLESYIAENAAAHGWKKATIKAYVQSLRAFFRYASEQGWCAKGVAETIKSPRIYSLAGLPQGPNWDQVRTLIAKLDTDRPADIRDRAIILLLAVYGLRIGEVCALKLEDLDWVSEKIRVRRSKNKRVQEFPLTAEVGNAILKYLQKARPASSSRFVLLSLRSPFHPLNGHTSSCSIGHRIRSLGCELPHYGPHSLRHACATHLLDEGFTLKEIGDHLGHRSPRSTRIYAKVERKKLQQVAGPVLASLKDHLRSQTQPITDNWTKERLNSLREVSHFRMGGLR